jgi:hypothetical protein
VLAGLGVAVSVLGWPGVVALYSGPISWRMEPKFPLPAALRIESEDHWLSRKHPEYVVARMIQAHTPPGARVLGFNGRAEAYTTREYAVTFQSARGEVLNDIFGNAYLADLQPGLRRTFSFAAQRVRGFRVIQTGNAKQPEEEWAVHEIRVFSKGQELPRAPDWRLKARPNPWDVQLAFDNSGVTRWRAWEPLRDGSFIQVDLFAPRAIDQVTLECAASQKPVGLRLELQDEKGTWKAAGGAPEDAGMPGADFQGRAAMGEIKGQGFDYLLLQTGEPGATEVAQDPAAWGLSPVARAEDVTLYRIDVPGPLYADSPAAQR